MRQIKKNAAYVICKTFINSKRKYEGHKQYHIKFAWRLE